MEKQKQKMMIKKTRRNPHEISKKKYGAKSSRATAATMWFAEIRLFVMMNHF